MKAVLITSSILILLIAALRPLLRGKIDPRVQYGLWLAVALRLLIPVNVVTSAYSALALLSRAEEPAQIVENIGQTTIPVQSYDSARTQVLEEYRQRGIVEAALTPSDLMNIEQQTAELMRGPTLAELAGKYARPVWLGGGLVTAVWFLLVNLRLQRRLRDAEFVEVDCPLPVYVSDALPSPCLYGVVRPAVYVTPAALESPDRLRHVLAHELTHYRHRDHWWALVRCLCLCAYWFNPLVWWAAALSRQDCELACDEGAIRRLGEEERLPYGRTLVDMIAAGRTPLLQTATTMAGGRRRVRERIKLIARRPKTVIAAALALAIVLGLAVGCTFTGAPEDSPEPGPSASQEPDGERFDPDTLQERLLDVPEEFREDVNASAGTKFALNDIALANYWFQTSDLEDELGWLLSVYKWEPVVFEDWLYNDDTGDFYVFARDGESYYAIQRPTSVTYYGEDVEGYTAAFQAIREFACQQVLSTQGVEAFDADELRSREVLLEGKTYTSVAYWPYKAINGNTDIVWLYSLVQPAKQGEGGVWIPERVQYIDNEHGVDPTPQRIKPDTGGMTVLEYGEQLQAEADAGDAGWATDPIEALRRYEEETGSQTNIPLDSFTFDSAYIENVLGGTLPTEEQKAVQAVVDQLMAASQLEISLAPAGTSRVYPYLTVPSEDYFAYYLGDLAIDFRWEKFDWGTTEKPTFPVPSDATSLHVNLPDYSVSLRVWENSDLVYLHDDVNGTRWYHAQYRYEDDGPLVYDRLRWWFDQVELDALRPTSVPNQGQSHEEIAREWAEGYEEALTQVAPGSGYACTSMEVINVKADLPDWLDQEGLEEYVRSHNFTFTAEDFGKTWFGFSYQTVFVPVDQSTSNDLWAGNTWYYEEEGAPEGALTYSRVGYMWLTDEGWTCTGTGTGW